MSLEVGLWRADGPNLVRLAPTGMALESRLEDYIEMDPMLLGEHLLVVGRQVATKFGGFIDLLAVDVDGGVHVIELKRDRTPRDVVAQVLDYGAWVAGLDRDGIVAIFEESHPGVAFDEAFVGAFGDNPPVQLNATQVFTIVAASVDPATERIVRFLNESFEVPVNVVFFRHFEHDGASFLARTWLVDEIPDEPVRRTGGAGKRTLEPWNGRDWFVSFGEEPGGRAWEDARKYGFVSAGGGAWYSRSLRNLPVGARVFTHIPKVGYVGVGVVTGEAGRFSDATVSVDGVERALSELSLRGTYVHDAAGDSEDTAEYVVPVEWVAAVPVSRAVWKTGMFANQNSACKLRPRFTIETVEAGLGVAPVE